MADVFISYSNRGERRAVIRRLATVLRAYGLTVWWDHGLEAGQNYKDRITAELTQATLIMPLWCSESIQSEWVHKEARIGVERKVLCPALLQNVPLPNEFSDIQTHDLIGWDGTLDEGICRFASEVCRRLDRPASAPPDFLEDLKNLPPVAALDTVKEVLGGASFEVYSNYALFGNLSHAGFIANTRGPIRLMGLSLMSFHRSADEPLGSTLRNRAIEGVPIQILLADYENISGLSHLLRDPDGTLTDRIAEEIRASFEQWTKLSTLHSNISVRRVSKAAIRHIATITNERSVMSPYWYAAAASNERPTLVCKPNSAFYVLLAAEFDALWSIASEPVTATSNGQNKRLFGIRILGTRR